LRTVFTRVIAVANIDLPAFIFARSNHRRTHYIAKLRIIGNSEFEKHIVRTKAIGVSDIKHIDTSGTGTESSYQDIPPRPINVGVANVNGAINSIFMRDSSSIS